MNISSLISTLQEYNRLGIPEQIDYKKFYLYSIITHSTAIEDIIPMDVTQNSTRDTQNVTQNSIKNVPSTENTMLTPRQRLRHYYNIQWLGSSKQGHWQILPQDVGQ